jgi:glutamate--cysteine ligase
MNKITTVLGQKVSEKRLEIEEFFKNKFAQTPALFYNSVDLRHNNGVKIAPIDTNCFPAGFNNINNNSKALAKKTADEFFVQNFSSAKNILIIPENHTRNLRYFENLKNLEEILGGNREVKIATLIPEITEVTKFDLEDGRQIELHPLQKNTEFLTTIDGFKCDVAILNNDLTDGAPDILKNSKTPIIPSVKLGWHSRTKSTHFSIYNELALELATIIEIDPWLISSMHSFCDDVDFKAQKGMDCLAKATDKLISDLRWKYQEYGIEDEPYCYIKADNGTYGMAVWPVFSGADVLQINKKSRNKMSKIKGAVENSKVMIQEGIPTSDRINGKIAEPMIYLINGTVIGNLFRVNESRDEKISLNAAGASFIDLQDLEESQISLGTTKNKIYLSYCLVAKLAALAAAIENSRS